MFFAEVYRAATHIRRDLRKGKDRADVPEFVLNSMKAKFEDSLEEFQTEAKYRRFWECDYFEEKEEMLKKLVDEQSKVVGGNSKEEAIEL